MTVTVAIQSTQSLAKKKSSGNKRSLARHLDGMRLAVDTVRLAEGHSDLMTVIKNMTKKKTTKKMLSYNSRGTLREPTEKILSSTAWASFKRPANTNKKSSSSSRCRTYMIWWLHACTLKDLCFAAHLSG